MVYYYCQFKMDITQPDASSEQGAFNAAVEYLKTLTAIERELDISFIDQDYKKIDRLLDVLWMELSEWFKEEEEKKQDEIRKNQKEAHQKYLEAMGKQKTSIGTSIIEQYIIRYKSLKKIIHDKALRMPKKDDPAFALTGGRY